MQHIVLVRHGSYNAETGELTAQGVNRTAELALILRDMARRANGMVRVYSSSSERATGSSDIIDEYLGLRHVRMGELDDTDDLHEVNQRMWRLAESYHDGLPARLVILVTHYPQVMAFVKHYFGEGSAQFKALPDVGCAEAVAIDADAHSLRLLNRRA